MTGLVHKIDSLLGTVVAAVAGLAGTQLLAFMQQYRQRLEGHLAEAELHVRQIREATLYANVEVTTKAKLHEAALDRVSELTDSLDAMLTADPVTRPFVFLAHLEREIARAALDSFQPALPLDVVSLAYGGAGMVLAWIVYELLKAPFAARVRRRA